MHTPGVCGAILTLAPATGQAQDQPVTPETAGRLRQWIEALNADSDMVLVAVAEGDEMLAPAAWERAAYVVPLRPGCSVADTLRALLQETLNRGRDSVLVTTLDTPPISGEAIRRIVDAYRAAGDQVWALLPEGFSFDEKQQGCYPLLLGRKMIELFLRTKNWSSAEEILLANREHVFALKSSDIMPCGTASLKQEP